MELRCFRLRLPLGLRTESKQVPPFLLLGRTGRPVTERVHQPNPRSASTLHCRPELFGDAVCIGLPDLVFGTGLGPIFAVHLLWVGQKRFRTVLGPLAIGSLQNWFQNRSQEPHPWAGCARHPDAKGVVSTPRLASQAWRGWMIMRGATFSAITPLASDYAKTHVGEFGKTKT
jgi:hypothetical protein